MVRRTRRAALLTLAMINVLILAAGIATARMLPPRLAALRVASVAATPVSGPGTVLAAGSERGTLPTASGLRSALAGPLSAAALGPDVSALVADLRHRSGAAVRAGRPPGHARLDDEAGHLGRRAGPAGPGRQVPHPGGPRRHRGQHRPGRRR